MIYKVDALGVITISRGCFERCRYARAPGTYHPGDVPTRSRSGSSAWADPRADMSGSSSPTFRMSVIG